MTTEAEELQQRTTPTFGGYRVRKADWELERTRTANRPLSEREPGYGFGRENTLVVFTG